MPPRTLRTLLALSLGAALAAAGCRGGSEADPSGASSEAHTGLGAATEPGPRAPDGPATSTGSGTGPAGDRGETHASAAEPIDAATNTAATGSADTSPARSRFVRAADSCIDCHSASPRASALLDETGKSVAPYDLWQGTMMANAARDPYWRAQVAYELRENPVLAEAIEAECLSCHAPAITADARLDGTPMPRLAVLDTNGPLGLRGRDGVTCTVCHQIQPTGLGTEASWGGQFEVDVHREIFGPYEEPWGEIMRNRSGYTPTHGAHVRESSLCASCHTLFTEPADAAGNLLGGHFPEQTIYLEWRNSRFSTEVDSPAPGALSCQDCHMPTRSDAGVPLDVRIARNPHGGDFAQIEPRSPFGQHIFVGANTLVPKLLAANADALDVRATPESLAATAEAALDQLQNRTATLELEGRWIAIDETSILDVRVGVTNLAGHKFPAGFPSRRAWLELVVTDATGAEIYVSGRPDATGRILDATGEPLASELAGGPLPAHARSISDKQPGAVAMWSAVAADADGAPTYSLKRATRWALDDRMLPAGWKPDGPHAETTAPVGRSATAKPGGDAVSFQIWASGSAPWRVRARLHYQTVGARHVAELRTHADAPEIAAFLEMLETHPPTSVIVAETEREIGGR